MIDSVNSNHDFSLFRCLPRCQYSAVQSGQRGAKRLGKGKIRYLNSRIIRDPYNPQLRLLMANAHIDDGRKFEAKKSVLSDWFYAEATVT